MKHLSFKTSIVRSIKFIPKSKYFFDEISLDGFHSGNSFTIVCVQNIFRVKISFLDFTYIKYLKRPNQTFN